MELTVPLPVSVKMKQPVHQSMALVHVKQVGKGKCGGGFAWVGGLITYGVETSSPLKAF